MSPRPAQGGGPRLILIPVRIALVTFLLTLLSFALSLLLGIVGTMLVAAVRGTPPHMTHAYRRVAVPVAGVAGLIALVGCTVVETRRYRQAKALVGIEKIS
jgi:uncharacterized membrane protein YuzA (DUF378 family)